MIEEVVDAVKKGISKVKTHSKQVDKGDIFIALPGVNKRGHEFVPEAIERGAKYIITSEPDLVRYKDQAKVIICKDVFFALGLLAKIQYNNFDLPYLIGITGTNGKTTVSYILEYLFKKAGISVGVIGTISYRWNGVEKEAQLTTPSCLDVHRLLSEMKKEVDVVIMEVSSHALDQRRVEGIKFDMAIFTNLTQDHLDYHGDMEHYFGAKKKLFSRYLKDKGVGITNLDDPYGRKIMDYGLVDYGYTFSDEGLLDFNEVMLADVVLVNRSRLILELEFKDKNWVSLSSLVGRHNAYNLAASQMAALLFGLDISILYSMVDFKGIPGRLERVYSNGISDVYIDYAHTPDGLKNVLCALKELNYRRIILVFGCGGERDRDKRPKMGTIASKYADLLIITSDNPRGEEPGKIVEDILKGVNSKRYVVEIDRKKAIEIAIENMQEGDAVLVAGKGHERYQYVKGKKILFSDKETVLEALKKVKQRAIGP